ncbi:small, acid-soluble spore protein, alpha/beta type [Desulforamulus putei]|uniref:Small, acid-soluble spore protein, alpha/beta type n=1 Tax=Desulforamulus putei DSM 12395 TaxID=1121429 RepID=A0A1M4UJQ9_9FIRM|nr:small, acid-soluble spore protein, alpha/beta type [Desulforamulus putei]SHE56800.1 Small, acid-soluble spore protein, alpha/beta type [Desulforamulus putei DSM 12395]
MESRIKTAKSREPGKGQNKKKKKPTPMDLLKLEIAAELGLAEKVKKEGWGALTSAESGRIGGIITQRAKKGLIDLDALRAGEL